MKGLIYFMTNALMSQYSN